MKHPKCSCWVESKQEGYKYRPAMQRLYIQVSENKKRTFKTVGWYCSHCKEVLIDE